METLHDYEITDRVAVLKKLRDALLSQREKFRRYLTVLEHQQQDIFEEDSEKLEAHVELEQSIVREIYAVQKVIDPLQDMYRMNYPQRESEIPAIEESLARLQERVLQRNRKNQNLLRDHMATLRHRIDDVRAVRARRSSFSGQPTPSLVDITT